MSATATVICPKCGGEMRTYERSGVQVDQCAECRGIFLDRGELEQLIDAASAGAPQEHEDEEHRGEHHHDERHDRDYDDHGGRRRKKSPASLLTDLLGGGGE